MAPRTHRKHGWWGGALVAAALTVMAACGGGGSGGPTRDTVPPNVVPERASAWTSITVHATASGRQATVPDRLKAKASPLLTGRLFDSPEPLSSYGLDAPSATITYTGADGRTRTIVVGDENFDGHGYYVQRKGDARVFLVPADQLEPLLDLVAQPTAAPR